MKRLVPPLLMAAILVGCGEDPPPPAPVLPVVAPKTAVAQAAAEVVVAELPATVVQPPGSRVAVAAPFAGMVQSVAVQPGQAVRRGQLLATMVSRDALVLAGDLARAEARQQMTGAEAARMATLAREGVVAGARADSAVAADAEAGIDAREARRLLSRAGADKDGTVRLVAPIAGRVASMSIEAGAPVDGMTAPFVIEADGSRWLALQLPERLAGAVKPGMAVMTRDGRRGRLETVAGAIDPATRAFAARARLEDGGALIGGRLLPVSLLAAAPEGAVTVPTDALVQADGVDLVFVKTARGFSARTVERAVGAGEAAVIVSGLKPGERVATSNLPELRATADR
ncbi:efflux RND transporter periplasmic adaptor subunit [Polymorphobacter sp.]|uniref:efflux RND transporter periplasmic adaptor subunit n=1 Tax=Polymorphobacter sp. TaxID=1909290 RepID=UPI003F70FDB8